MTTLLPSIGRTIATLAGIGLCLSPAQAADRAVYTKAAPAASYNWSGYYLGVQGGGFYGRDTVSTPGGELLNPLSIHDGSYFVGGYTGVNFQSGRLVYGVEGDFSKVLGGRNLSASQQTTTPGVSALGQIDPKWTASVTARLGVALDNWLLYAKGGATWMKADYTGEVRAGGVTLGTETLSATRRGWLAGAGIEYAWNSNWVSRLEYNYVKYSNDQLIYSLAGFTAADFDSKAHIVKGGLSYKFGSL